MGLRGQDGAADSAHLVSLKVAYLPVNVLAQHIIAMMVTEGGRRQTLTVAAMDPLHEAECQHAYCTVFVSGMNYDLACWLQSAEPFGRGLNVGRVGGTGCRDQPSFREP
jgi:hypothetical protein